MGKWAAIYNSNKCDESTRVNNLTVEGSPQSGWRQHLHVAALNAVVGCDVCTWYGDPAHVERRFCRRRRLRLYLLCRRPHGPGASMCRRLDFQALFSCDVPELNSVNGSLRSWDRRHLLVYCGLLRASFCWT
ncbi:unnamed protein product [Cuscuta europaea]|uniref:Uncharacterized protein n=1 Tax=Cuscuta europaea TaxID=41803 RepID=A0A9P1EAY5_CUSEU|nr:unnamed protein product [Cuscuta europaea]